MDPFNVFKANTFEFLRLKSTFDPFDPFYFHYFEAMPSVRMTIDIESFQKLCSTFVVVNNALLRILGECVKQIIIKVSWGNLLCTNNSQFLGYCTRGQRFFWYRLQPLAHSLSEFAIKFHSSSSRQGFSCWCGWTREGFWPSSTFSKDAWGLLKSIRKEVEEGNGNAKRNSRQTGGHRREDGCGVNSLEKPYLIWPWPWWRRPWTRRRHFSLRGGRGRARRSPTWPISSILHHCSCLLKPANEDKINCFDVSKLEFSKRPLKAVVFSFW